MGWGIRLSLADVKGITGAEVARIVAAREGAPYASLTDFWQRARVSRPVAERLVQAGAFDAVYGIGATGDLRRRGRVTRRDLLLQVADLDRHGRALERAARGRAPSGRRPARQIPIEGQEMALGPVVPVRERAAAQSRATRPAPPVTSVQLALDLGDGPAEGESSGLPEMTASDRVRAELDILGLDASSHVLDFHQRFLDQLGVVRSTGLLAQRSRSQILVAGVKVATQTPPIRSGRRVIFLTLDDATGPVDATFFEDVQGPYAATVFGSWLLVVRGVVRRTGRRGISLRATGAWDLGLLADRWSTGGVEPRRWPRSTGCRRRSRRSTRGRRPSGCWCTAAASGCRRTPTSSRPASPRARSPARWPASCGTAAPGARDESPRVGDMDHTPPGARCARPPAGTPKSTAPSNAALPCGPPWSGTPCSRCSAHRAAGSLDIGGGTGGFAVRLAEQGHRVTVVDPSPDALAALGRRAAESGVADRVTGVQGDLAGLADVVDRRAPTWCSATACSSIVDDPAAALATIGGVLRPGGTCHLLVGQRHAAVLARAMAGHFRQAVAALDDTGDDTSGERRFTATEVTDLLAGSGFTPQAVHGVRVFADLVPGSLLDLEPGAGAALLDLERAVADRPEYLTLAAQLHVLATH